MRQGQCLAVCVTDPELCFAHSNLSASIPDGGVDTQIDSGKEPTAYVAGPTLWQFKAAIHGGMIYSKTRRLEGLYNHNAGNTAVQGETVLSLLSEGARLGTHVSPLVSTVNQVVA